MGTRLTCPEAYHIEHLYDQGYGCRLIADMIDRREETVDRWLRGAYGHRTLVKLIGRRLSNGKRPASMLARSWEVCR